MAFDKKQWSKERYEFYKSHGICVNCGQEKAERGLTVCWRCKLNKREAKQEWYANLSPEEKAAVYKKRRESMRKLTEARKAAGKCVYCDRKAKEGYSVCPVHLERQRRYNEKRRAKNGAIPMDVRSDGHRCFLCLTEDNLAPRKKVCQKCYEKLKARLEYGRSCIKEPNYFNLLNNAFWNEKKSK